MRKMAQIGSFKNVNIYVHWSVSLVLLVAVLGTFRNPSAAIFGFFSFGGLMLLHEIGHTLVAHRLGYDVFEIELYPFHGRVHYQAPWSRHDECLIAGGGVAAQIALAIPVIACLERFGYPKNDAMAAVLVILGPLNAIIAGVNLVPAPGLDGAHAWHLIPLAIRKLWDKRHRRQTTRRQSNW